MGVVLVERASTCAHRRLMGEECSVTVGRCAQFTLGAAVSTLVKARGTQAPGAPVGEARGLVHGCAWPRLLVRAACSRCCAP